MAAQQGLLINASAYVGHFLHWVFGAQATLIKHHLLGCQLEGNIKLSSM
jgi:hypothetical protein